MAAARTGVLRAELGLRQTEGGSVTEPIWIGLCANGNTDGLSANPCVPLASLILAGGARKDNTLTYVVPYESRSRSHCPAIARQDRWCKPVSCIGILYRQLAAMVRRRVNGSR